MIRAKKFPIRFWASLKRLIKKGRYDDACDNFQNFCAFYINKKVYPEDFGFRILHLFRSLADDISIHSLLDTVIPIHECFRIIQFADKSQSKDVQLFLDAIILQKYGFASEKDQAGPNIHISAGKEKNRLESVLSEIGVDTLTKSIGLPIDSARAAYSTRSVTVNTHEEFMKSITSFFGHILDHTQSLSIPRDTDTLEAEAFALLERTFVDQGGFKAALAEAKTGHLGGLRYIFDEMTERYKRDQKEKHVRHALRSSLDPLDWDKKVGLMASLLDRLKTHLPAEVASQPAERYAGHYEEIVKAYVRSMDRVRSIFKSY